LVWLAVADRPIGAFTCIFESGASWASCMLFGLVYIALSAPFCCCHFTCSFFLFGSVTGFRYAVHFHLASNQCFYGLSRYAILISCHCSSDCRWLQAVLQLLPLFNSLLSFVSLGTSFMWYCRRSRRQSIVACVIQRTRTPGPESPEWRRPCALVVRLAIGGPLIRSCLKTIEAYFFT
jgi:hypothetical protein